MIQAVDVEQQTPLFDLSGREFNAMWVDEKAPLFVANNPLHWQAHELQVLAARLKKQSERNPAQFNSTTYLSVLDKLRKCMDEINGELPNSPTVQDSVPGSSIEVALGETNAPTVGAGISADNPFAGKRPNPV